MSWLQIEVNTTMAEKLAVRTDMSPTTYRRAMMRIKYITFFSKSSTKSLARFAQLMYDHAWPTKVVPTFPLGIQPGVAREFSRVSRCFPDFLPHFIQLLL